MFMDTRLVLSHSSVGAHGGDVSLLQSLNYKRSAPTELKPICGSAASRLCGQLTLVRN
jgi:hypothetical protein